MTLYAKSILAVFFLAAGVCALLLMLALMGRAERKVSASILRRGHKGAGFVFLALTIVISYYCLAYVASAGGALSPRAALHMVFALALFIVLVLKVLIVRFFREFLRIVPTLGFIVFALSFVVFGTSAGHYFVRRCGGSPGRIETPAAEPGAGMPARAPFARGDETRGAALFERSCRICHDTDHSEATGGSPGLKGILSRGTLPVSGRPATAKNIGRQIREPVGSMPAFETLSDAEIADILAYLETL